MTDAQDFTTRTAAQLLDNYRVTLIRDNSPAASTPYTTEIVELAAKIFTLLSAGNIPNLPASIITSGAFDDSRIPSSIARDSEVTAAIAAAIAAHLAASNPHPEYIDAAELATAIANFIVTTDPRLIDARTPTDGSVTDVKVAIGAAIAWAKISKTGAVAADVGADPSGTAASLIAAITPTSIGAQPIDSDLTAIAALTTTAYGRALLTLADQAALLVATGAQPLDSDLTAIAALSTTTFGRSLLTLADAAALLSAAGAQASDSDLTAIAGLTTTGLIERTGTGTASTATVTTFAKTLLDDADAATARTTLGLGTAATSASTDFQPVDSDLTAIAALSTTSYGRSFLALADAAAALTLVGAQPLDSDLTAIAALSTTSYGRSLLTLADATALLTATGAQPLDTDLTAIAALTTASYGRSLLTFASAAATVRDLLEVDTQRGATKPTTRRDGTTLINGDRWFDTSTNLWFFWNSALSVWMTETLFIFNGNSTSAAVFAVDETALDVYFERFLFTGVTGATNNATQYTEYRAQYRDGTTDTSFSTASTVGLSPTTRFAVSVVVNQLFDVSALSIKGFRVQAFNISSGSAATVIAFQLTGRYVKP